VTSPAFQALSAAVASACGVAEPRPPSSSVDWAEFTRLVDRHSVAPLVQRSKWLDRSGAPSEVREAVGHRARQHALLSLRVQALQREVIEVLRAAGAQALVLKGVALAVDGYDDPSIRAPGDIDLLVGPESVHRAIGALRLAGLEWYGWRRPEDPDRPPVGPEAIERLPQYPMLRDVTLTRAGIHVEIHWRLFANARLLPVDSGWLERPRYIRVQSAEVPTLPLDAQWLHVLVHGSNHLWSLMKWLADVPALALRHPQLIHRATLRRVDDAYRRSLATGLLVAEAVFGCFLPRESRAWASGTRGTRMLVRKSLSALTADHDPPKLIRPRAVPGVVIGRLALRADARYRLEELRLLLLSAGRAQGVPDPGLVDLAAGPFRWTRRTARRLAKQHARR
jgi:putative nucleotidyltransferase-like protein